MEASEYLGKVRTEKVKKQELVKSLTIISSARLRNRIAGYITRLLASVEADQISETEETE